MSDTTKRALAASLKKLLEKQTLNKITVKDIVEDCGVNRQTFYYHFHDIYDLMEWIFSDETEKRIVEKMNCAPWNDGILEVFKYMRENRSLITNACHSLSREDLERYLFRRIYPIIRSIAEAEIKEYDIQEADIDFAVKFYAYALIGVGMEWVNQGMDSHYDERLAKYFMLLHGSLPRELKRLAEKKEK